MEPLTIESLARAIHEDTMAAGIVAGFTPTMHDGEDQPEDFESLPDRLKIFRREQARLLFNRIMR